MHPFTSELAAKLPGPQWLKDRRVVAAEIFAGMDMVSADSEEWRYSPIEKFDFSHWAPHIEPSGGGEAGVAASQEWVTAGGNADKNAVAGGGPATGGDPTGDTAGEGTASGAAAAGPITETSDSLPANLPFADVLGFVSCVDGWVRNFELSPELAAKGVRLGPAEQPEDLPAFGAGVVGADARDVDAGFDAGFLGADSSFLDASTPGDIFSKLCEAFCPQPVVLHVPRGVDVEGSIIISHYFTVHNGANGANPDENLDGSPAAKNASFPYLSIHLAENSSVAVLEVFASQPDAELFLSPLTEMSVGNSSRLRYLAVQNVSRNAWIIASQVATVQSQATLKSSTAALGGSYARLRTDCQLLGRGSTGDIAAVSFANKNQTIDFRTFHSHIAPDTSSNLLFKGAVDDSARSIYTGMIRVAKHAKGTNAKQTNQSLKLSEEAWSESVPNLEIENNDVSCSHASTAGPLEEDQMFYLQSRGVPTEVAERLIVDGFFEEVLDLLAVPEAVPMVRKALHNKLPYEFAD